MKSCGPSSTQCALTAPLRCAGVDLTVAAGADRDDEDFDFLTVNVVDDANVVGADAAVARQLLSKR